MRHGLLLLLLIGLALVLGCPTAGPDGDDDAADDDAADDDTADDDAGDDDTGDDDTADDDTGDDDSGDDDTAPAVPLDGFGTITGECGVIEEATWTSGSPALFRNAIDFGSDVLEDELLSPGGQEILADGNLNEGSLYSEIFAFELLYRCELAELVKTESEVVYVEPNGKKTDLLLLVDQRSVGVSVTRAFHYPPQNPYTLAEAQELLTDKLSDLPLSAANADPADAWQRSFLHVVAYDAQYADEIEAAYASLDPSLTQDYFVIVTVSDGLDDFLY